MYENFFNYGELKPEGWIKEQLKAQAKGLAGNLDKIWPDVRDSRWIGGNRDGWERFPYFMDGFVPLAYLLDDEDLKARAEKYIAALEALQAENGCIFPKGTDEKGVDIWPMFLVLKVLAEYGAFTGDRKAEETVYRGLKYLSRYVCDKTLFDWAAARWFECLIPILWIYERRPEEWLLTFARRLKLQGIDYAEAALVWGDGVECWNFEKHVVNVAMALKAEALASRLFGTEYSGRAEDMLRILEKQCGTAYGHFNGDECLAADDSPVRGSELCGVVEAMFSYEILSACTKEAVWGDRLEALAFNGLPAAVSGDMWAHQYDQQVNQIACVPFEKPVFATNSGESNLFGLEPQCGCCTANFGQGWPKFVRSAYMRTEEGIAVVSPVPMRISARSGEERIFLECVSEYPFKNKFTLRYEGNYTLSVRLPEWAEARIDAPARFRGGWADVRVSGKGEINVEFACEPRLVERSGGLHCLKYGALLFALPVPYTEERAEYVRDGTERKYPYCDYVYRPAGDWGYAFAGKGSFKVERHAFSLPYDKKTPPVTVECRMLPVKWGFKPGYKDVADDHVRAEPLGKAVLKKLWPYGATYLRMTEMPVCEDKDEDQSKKEL